MRDARSRRVVIDERMIEAQSTLRRRATDLVRMRQRSLFRLNLAASDGANEIGNDSALWVMENRVGAGMHGLSLMVWSTLKMSRNEDVSFLGSFFLIAFLNSATRGSFWRDGSIFSLLETSIWDILVCTTWALDVDGIILTWSHLMRPIASSVRP